MTSKEALSILYKGIAPNPTTNNQCIELCKKALEKQIPQKPLEEAKFYGNGKCPSCGAVFMDKSTNYCGNCGQALDWSDTE